jgi:IS5 family transposase
MPLESMVRIDCAQNWFNFSDREMEDALYEIESLRRFAGFSGIANALPDETTILNFRHFLEKHDLTAALLEEINARLKAQGLLVSKGSMVDATITHAPSSTKNQRIKRAIPRCTRPSRAISGTSACADVVENRHKQELGTAQVLNLLGRLKATLAN